MGGGDTQTNGTCARIAPCALTLVLSSKWMKVLLASLS